MQAGSSCLALLTRVETRWRIRVVAGDGFSTDPSEAGLLLGSNYVRSDAGSSSTGIR